RERQSLSRPLGNNSYDLEKSHRFLIVRHKHVLGLTIVVEHHLVILASKARFLVPAKWSVSRVAMIIVYPDAAGLDRTWDPIKLVRIACPDARTQTIKCVIRDLDSLGFVLKCR